MKSLAVLALASMASATYFNAELLRREIVHVVVEIRQATAAPTASGSASGTASGAVSVVSSASAASTDACSSVLAGLASLVTGLPVPTGALSSYLATAATTLTNPCSLSIPSSVASDFSVYETSVISFYNAHSSQLSSALSACPSLTSLVQNPVCSTSAGGASATAAATGSASESATATKTSPAPVSSAGANPGQETQGLVAAIIAAAGVVGAVVAL
jgi:hypothetical protein